MDISDRTDKPDMSDQDSIDKPSLQKRIWEARDAQIPSAAGAGGPPGDGGDGDPIRPGTLSDASENRSGTFRYYDLCDQSLNGEVRTATDQADSIHPIAQAELFRRDGSREIVGTARYHVAGDEARIYPETLRARNYGVEDALLKEVSEQAQAKEASRLRVWVRDGDSEAESRWSSHSFHPTERNPGAAGVDWERPL